MMHMYLEIKFCSGQRFDVSGPLFSYFFQELYKQYIYTLPINIICQEPLGIYTLLVNLTCQEPLGILTPSLFLNVCVLLR